MYEIHSSFYKFLIGILVFITPFSVLAQPPNSEEEILLTVKEQWGNQPAFKSWDATASHCRWPGIECADDDTVTGISLVNLSIKGEIPPSICDLKNLTTLDLRYNYLGGQFPTVLYKCTELQKLNLSYNNFVGQLPDDINSLSPNLQHLDLSYNNFSGNIPSSIGQLEGLITLHLEWNLFNGTFPSELGNLRNLEVLFLAYNPFSPMELPAEFGQLRSIKFLWMTQCNLTGNIPESFGNLSSLEHLDLSRNKLEGGILSGLFLLKNFKLLYLYNNTLSGEFPASIEALNLVEIDVSDNNMRGTIPEGIGNLQKLELLSLFDNKFHGSLPPRIGLIPTLKRLKVWNNKFSGPLPPELGRHSRFEALEATDNEFTGQLPEDLCWGGALLGVAASRNRLNGSIPKSLGQCNSLRTIQLDNNYFSGDVPKGLWTSQNISSLMLSNNQLSGQLPDKLARNLTVIEISNNRFSGQIPPSVRYWDQLTKFEASNNLISGTIPLELTSLSKLNLLSLDGNRLSGQLPSQIISWVNLNSLKLLRNQLTGSIPSALGSLPVLNYLDLSNNQFSGQIPSELGHLELSFLNLSSNTLVGEIPYGYDNAAYSTSFLNTRLCSVSGILDFPRCKIYRENAQKFSSKYVVLIIFFGSIAIAYFNCLIIFKLRKREHTYDMSSWKVTSFQKLDFTEEIRGGLIKSNLIGSGGCGEVYRIPVNGGRNFVAAKMIRNKKMNEKQFLTEVQVLGATRHINIVKLLCCMSSEHSKILVYEYMENQSLDKWIHKWKLRPASSTIGGSENQKVLDWPTRLRVAVGVAKGLSYMHHDNSAPIIHRDVKSSNILLDANFDPKIADFGLARILAENRGEPHAFSDVAGSFGYMAPECFKLSKVNEKMDIYSFGVVLLELVTGKEAHHGRDENSNLAQWALWYYNEGLPIADALDEKVRQDCYLEEMTDVFKLGVACTDPGPAFRPPMKMVLQALQQFNSFKGYGGTKPEFSPLHGSDGYISTCGNSSEEIEEDDYMV